MTTTVTTASSLGTANGVTPIPFTFQSLSAAEIAVYRNGVFTDGTTYTVTRNADGTGSIVPKTTWGSDSIEMFSLPNYNQPTNFGRFGAWYPDNLNTPMDRAMRTLIALRAHADRGVAGALSAATTAANTASSASTTAAQALAAANAALASGGGGGASVLVVPLRIQRKNNANTYFEQTYGRGDTASTFSISSGFTYDRPADILAPNQQYGAGILGQFEARDGVALFVERMNPPLLTYGIANNNNPVPATFSTTGVTFSTPLPADVVAALRVGMIIESTHVPKWSGEITGWAANGTSATVSGWYQFLGAGVVPVAGTPPAGLSAAAINPTYKGWTVNFNSHMTTTSFGDESVGIELGVFQSRGAMVYGNHVEDMINGQNKAWGYDAANIGDFQGAVGYVARRNFFRGFVSRGQDDAGFIVEDDADFGNPLVGFRSLATTGIPFQAAPGGRPIFAARNDGVVDIGYYDNGSASTAQVRLHSSGFLNNGDVQIRGVGGIAAMGNGRAEIQAASVNVYDPSDTYWLEMVAGTSPSITPYGTNANIPLLLRAKAAGAVQVGIAGNNLGFFGGGGNPKQDVTGSRGGNAALTSLLAALALYNVINNNTTA